LEPSGLFHLSSKLGYLLKGKFSDPNSNTKSDNHLLVAYFVMTHMNQCVSEINLFSAADTTTNKMPDLSDMQRLETIVVTNPSLVSDNDKALKQFNDSIVYDGEQYQVRWPWKSGECDLPDNYDVAFG